MSGQIHTIPTPPNMNPLDFLLGRYQTETYGQTNASFGAEGVHAGQLTGVLMGRTDIESSAGTLNSDTVIAHDGTYVAHFDHDCLQNWQKTLASLNKITTPNNQPIDLTPYPENPGPPRSIHFNANTFLSDYNLNEDQTRVVCLFIHHVMEPPETKQSFRAMLFGEGGTGKSKVIKCIKDFFKAVKKEEELLLDATTGVAAGNIHGSTVHSSLGVRPNSKKGRKATNVGLGMGLWVSVGLGSGLWWVT